MHRSLLIGLILGLVLSGCATTESVSELELSRFRNRISVLEEELEQSQQKNLSLKEKLMALEQVVIKMPTAAEIQTALKNANFYQGEIDGQIGSDTKEAIMKFQEAHGLTTDGVIGSQTWAILGKYLKKQSE